MLINLDKSSCAQKNQFNFLSTQFVSRDFSNLVALLRYRALHQPNKVAFSFLKDGEIESDTVTYQELDQKARAIAVELQSICSEQKTQDFQTKALLLYPAGIHYIAAFFGCLYANVIAIPAYPPKANRSLFRLQSIVADSKATVVLSTSSVYSQLKSKLAEEASNLQTLHWVNTNNIANERGEKWQEPETNSDTLAFFQYTSGSTGLPKGVMVSHGNLLHNSADLDLGWEHTSNSIMVTWLPIFHDMGLIYGVIQPLYKGFPCYMMAPEAFMQKPIRWLQAISDYRATHSAAPNFAYELCARKITLEQRQSLDLSCWEMALNGAEPIKKETLIQFAEAFAPFGFRFDALCPGYGLAENTLKVTAVRKTDKPVFLKVETDALYRNQVVETTEHHQKVQTLVGCGRPMLDTNIAIVHPQLLTQLANNEVGEIWVSSSSVTKGYWNQPQNTDSTFRAYLKDTGQGPFIRTGDLGFFKNGELFVTGRLKDVIIILGRYHYPLDIVVTIEKSLSALRPGSGAAFSIEIDGHERLVVAQEVERTWLRNLNVDEVVENVRQAVSKQHELQVYAVLLLKTASIPKTSSGKIQRRTCKVAFLEDNLNIVGKWMQSNLESKEVRKSSDEFHVQNLSQSKEVIQSWLISYLSQLLIIEPHKINVQMPFEYYGLDSADSLSLIGDLEGFINRKLSPKLIHEYPTIEAFVSYLAK